ncbi:MAG: hypothetical protein C4584_01165 [Armatimonadetes bacterium]|nr:MAG: hypothetical protein C4584_01165 [Armatimonadota bacterium]
MEREGNIEKQIAGAEASESVVSRSETVQGAISEVKPAEGVMPSMIEWLAGFEGETKEDWARRQVLEYQAELSEEEVYELEELRYKGWNSYLKVRLPVMAATLVQGWRTVKLPDFIHGVSDGEYGSNTLVGCSVWEDHGELKMDWREKGRYAQKYVRAIQEGDLRVIAVGLRAETMMREMVEIDALGQIARARAILEDESQPLDFAKLEGIIEKAQGECSESENCRQLNRLLEERGVNYDPNFTWQELLKN